MRRFYLSPMVEVRPGLWEPKIFSVFKGVPGAGVVSVPPADPAAAGARALCLVNAPDQTPGTSDPDLDTLPDLTLDAALSTLPANVRNAMLSRLQSRGFDTSGITTQTAYRVLIRRLGRRFQGNFDENGFDVNPAG